MTDSDRIFTSFFPLNYYVFKTSRNNELSPSQVPVTEPTNMCFYHRSQYKQLGTVPRTVLLLLGKQVPETMDNSTT